MNNLINWSYIAGLIDSDGSIQCFLDEQQLKYTVKITSKSNANTLRDVDAFLRGEDFTTGDTDQNNEDRAPSARVQGNEQVVRLLKKIKEEVSCFNENKSNYKCPLLGQKLRNMDLILAVPDQSVLTPAQKIDFKKTFHKGNYEQADIYTSSTIPRYEYEKSFGLELNSSIGSLEDVIKPIDSKYSEHAKELDSFIKMKGRGTLNADYVVGLFDGDGGFNLSFARRREDRLVDVQCDLNLTVPRSDADTLYALVKHFGITSRTIARVGASRNSVQLKIRSAESLAIVIAFFDKHPLLGDYKSKCFALLKETVEKEKAKYFSKKTIKRQEFKDFINGKDALTNLRGSDRKKLFKFIDEHYKL